MAKGKHKQAGRANPKQKRAGGGTAAADDSIPEPPPRPKFGGIGLVACLAIGVNFLANVTAPWQRGGRGGGGRAGGGGRWGGGCPIGVDEARLILTDAAQYLEVDPRSAFARLDELVECGPPNKEEIQMNLATWRSHEGEHLDALRDLDDLWATADREMVDGGAMDAYLASLEAVGRLDDVVAVIQKALDVPSENDDRDALRAQLCFALARLGRATEGVAFLANSAVGVTGGAGVRRGHVGCGVGR